MHKKITVLTLSAMLFALCGSAAAQQPKKVTTRSVIYRRSIQLVSLPVPRQFGWLCASLAT